MGVIDSKASASMSAASLASKVFEDAEAFCNCVSMNPGDAEEFANASAMRRGVTVPHGAGGTPDRIELAKLFRQHEALRAEVEYLKNQKLEGGPLPDELLTTSVYSKRQHTSARHGGSAEPHTVARFTEKQIQGKMIAKMLAAEKIWKKSSRIHKQGMTMKTSMPPTKLPETTDKHMHTLKDCDISICPLLWQ